MIKVNASEQLLFQNEFSWDQDQTTAYGLAEIETGELLFHVDVLFGAAGCCDNGCNSKNRYLTTDVMKAVTVASQNTVLESDIVIQYKTDETYGLLQATHIQVGVDTAGRTVSVFHSKNKSLVYPHAQVSDLKDLKTVYQSGEQAYWKD